MRTAPAVQGNHSHLVIAGEETTLKGTSSVAGTDVQATWDFGDGSEPVAFAVADGYNVSARHAYQGAPGARFTAKLTVVNGANGESATASYDIQVAARTLDTEAVIALDEGLWYLHRTMNRVTVEGRAGGDWGGMETASGVLAFELAGHLPTGDPTSPYTETVGRAMNSMLAQAGDAASRSEYWVRALEAASDFDRVAEAGPADVAGRRFSDIVKRHHERARAMANVRPSDGGVSLWRPMREVVSTQSANGSWMNSAAQSAASVQALALGGPSTIYNVSRQVMLSAVGLLPAGDPNVYVGTLTVINVGGTTIQGPVDVVFTLMSRGITLLNADGTYNGNQYRVLPGVTMLGQWQQVSVPIRFSNPNGVNVAFIPVVYSGVFPPQPVGLGCPAPYGVNGLPYNSALAGTGGIQYYYYSINGMLPPGLSLDSGSGAITGTPTFLGPFLFTAMLQDGSGLASGSVSSPCTITVNPPLSVSCPSSNGQATVSYSSALVAKGGVPGYTYSTDGTLPKGLTLDPSTGALTGTPTVDSAGPYNFTAKVTDSYTPTAKTASASCSLTIAPPPTVSITLRMTPGGQGYTVDNVNYAADHIFDWVIGSQHTIATTSPQYEAPTGIRYVFNHWSDGGAISHNIITPPTPTIYEAIFDPQFLLTLSASPSGAGTLSPSSATYYASNSVQNISATANSGYQFRNWTGGTVGSSTSAITTVTMSGPVTLTANFDQTVPVTVQAVIGNLSCGSQTNDVQCQSVSTLPSVGLAFKVDGVSYNSSQVFNWVPNSQHTIEATSPQACGQGTQCVFNAWSDTGAQSHQVTAPSAPGTTYTAYFSQQYLLTLNVSPSSAGTVLPSSATYYAANSVQNISATANSGYQFRNWTGGTVGNATNASTTVTMNGPVTLTANFDQLIQVTVRSALSNSNAGQTTAAAPSFTVDNQNYFGSQQFYWVPGSQHTLSATSPQNGGGGVQWVFNNWSDSGAISHAVAPSSATTYTATFDTRYQLNLSASPSAGGTLTPTSGSYFAANSVQNISATANSGYQFKNWTGGTVANANSASTTVTMNAPVNLTANFDSLVQVTVQTSPPGQSFTVDNTSYSTPQIFSWISGSQHTIATTSPQGSGGTRYVFNNWSDGGAISHSVAPTGAVTYTANFDTQYQLTLSASPSAGGTVTPSSPTYYAANSVQSIAATANSNYVFSNWTGGTVANANSSSTTVQMNGPVSLMANFTNGNAPQITSGNSVTFAPGKAGQTFPVTTTGVPSGASMSITDGGGFPPGVSLVNNNNGTATIQGTPAFGTAGNSGNPPSKSYPVVITANNGVSPNAQQNFTLTIACPAISVTGANSFNLVYNSQMSASPYSQANGNGAISWSISGQPGGIGISASGQIFGTPTATGNFNATVTATDVGGCTGIKVVGFSVAPVAVGDAFNSSAGVVDNTQFVVTGGLTATPSTPVVTTTGNILSNDLPSGGVAATAGTFGTSSGGSVTIAADGTFLYTPTAYPSGGAITSDSFNYTVVSNGVTSAPAMVTIALTGRVWYVKSGGSDASSGRSHEPFLTLGKAASVSTPGDTIYLYAGNDVNLGAFTFQQNQSLIGQGTALVVNGNTLVAAGSFPTLGGTLTANTTGVTANGLSLLTGSSTALSMTNAGGNLTFRSINTNGANPGISITGGSANVTVTGDGSGQANGSGGSIQNAGSNGAMTLSTAGGTLTFKSMNFPLSSNSAYGILFDNNAGGAVAGNFTGCTFTAPNPGSVNQQKASLQFEAGSSANVTANVQNSYFNGGRTYGVYGTAAGSATLNVTVNQSGFGTDVNSGAPVNKPGTTITNPPPYGIAVTNSSNALVDYTISNNTFWGASAAAGALYVVTVSGASTNSGSHLTGSISGNQIGKTGVAGSGCSGNCAAIGLLPGVGGLFNATVTNNDIRRVGAQGINFFNTVPNASGNSKATIQGNTLTEPELQTGENSPGLSHRAIVVSPGNSQGTAATWCAVIGGTGQQNTISGANWQTAFSIRITTNNTVGTLYIPGVTPTTLPLASDVDLFVTNTNTLQNGNQVGTSIGAGAISGNACPF